MVTEGCNQPMVGRNEVTVIRYSYYGGDFGIDFNLRISSLDFLYFNLVKISGEYRFTSLDFFPFRRSRYLRHHLSLSSTSFLCPFLFTSSRSPFLPLPPRLLFPFSPFLPSHCPSPGPPSPPTPWPASRPPQHPNRPAREEWFLGPGMGAVGPHTVEGA